MNDARGHGITKVMWHCTATAHVARYTKDSVTRKIDLREKLKERCDRKDERTRGWKKRNGGGKGEEAKDASGMEIEKRV